MLVKGGPGVYPVHTQDLCYFNDFLHWLHIEYHCSYLTDVATAPLVVTPITCKSISKNLTGIFAKSKISSMDKWRNGALIPPTPGVLCNIGYPSEPHLKLKSHEISFVHNICCDCPIGLKFCTEHGSDTVVLCTKFQSNRSTEAWVMGKRYFARSHFKMNFGRISYIAQGPWTGSSPFRQMS